MLTEHIDDQSTCLITHGKGNNVIHFVKVGMTSIEKRLANCGSHSNRGCDANLKKMMVRSKLDLHTTV